MNEAKAVFEMPSGPVPTGWAEPLSFEFPDSSLPELERKQQLGKALSQQLAGSSRLHLKTQQLCTLLQQSENRLFGHLIQVLGILAKRRKDELEKLVQHASLLLGPTFVPHPSRSHTPPEIGSTSPQAYLAEVQHLLDEYLCQQKVFQCGAWQAEEHADKETARWLEECCQRLRQDTLFLESAIAKVQSVLKPEHRRGAAYVYSMR